jgi:predicted dehydrogenase
VRPRPEAAPARPRLGFLGVGWIGRHRLRALAEAGVAEIAAVADASEAAAREAAGEAPGCATVGSLDALLDVELDGLVIATPSALHAEQAVAALERGVAVFCQKPLARTAAEARWVVDAARAADRLLGVDLSYRHVAGVSELRRLVQDGALGRIFAADLTFHNAYGPDKAWYADPRLSGGGCVMDLGIHLVDLALWVLGAGAREVASVHALLRAGGEPVAAGGARPGGASGPPARAEDFAVAQLELAGGTAVRLACSWRLAAGQDCVIEAAFHGTRGGAVLRNLDGSFYDLAVERLDGTRRVRLAGPPDPWGGRAAVVWARALAAGARFDPEVERLVDVHVILDRVLGR